MKLNAVKENKKIKINSNLTVLKRLGISGANCLLVKKAKNFCVIEIVGKGQFAIEEGLARQVVVEYV